MHRHRRRWTESEIEFLKANRRGHTRAWLAEQLGRQPEAIKHKITELQALKFKVRVYKARATNVPSGQKLCRKCGLVKDLDEFHVQLSCKDGHQNRCKSCSTAMSIKWNREHPEAHQRSVRTYQLKKAYGLSRAELEELVARQNGACPICLMPLGISIHIDHDHATGRVRGALHAKCNAGLGALGDSPEVLQRAIAYLKA